MNRRMLHGLLGCLILSGLLAVGLAFTYAVDQPEPRVVHDCYSHDPAAC